VTSAEGRASTVFRTDWGEALVDFSVEEQIFMEVGFFDVVWAGEII
jgi:hypothetical protein